MKNRVLTVKKRKTTKVKKCEVKVKGGNKQNGSDVFEMWENIGGNEIK
jgi:hypothetical protein